MQKIMLNLLIIIFTLYITQHVFADISTSSANPINLNFPQTESPSIILIDSKTGQILYEKNAHEKLFPASITKIMTALITLERCKLDENVVASNRAVSEIEFGSSNVGFSQDEELTIEQLLYALMLESANEAANILAEHVGGSIEDFSEIMNARAKELGALNTHFVTPNGLHKDEHITTVYDMSLITRHAMTIPEFRKITATTYYKLPPTNKYTTGFKEFYNHNKLLLKNSEYYYPYAIGGKTGYTTRAGHSLVGCASKDGMELIAVCMNSSKINGISQPYNDFVKLFEYTFNNYNLKEPIKAGTLVKQLIVPDTKENVQLQVIAKDNIQFIWPLNNKAQQYTINEVINPQMIKAPIAQNTVVGYIEYLLDGVVLGKSELITANSIENITSSKPVANSFAVSALIILRNIVIIFLILFMALIIFAQVKKKRKNKKSRLMKIEKLIKD